MRKILDFIYDILFPITCQSCGKEGKYICNTCSLNIDTPRMFCPECDELSPFGQIHPTCAKQTSPLSGVLVASPYSNQVVKNLIWQYKYNFARTIAPDLATLLTDFIIRENLQDFFSDFTVSSVPLHERRKKMRGFNQAELIARQTAENLGLKYSDYLQRVKKTKRQVDLHKDQRAENVKDAFAMYENKKPADKILLIDDISTTNSTLRECAKVLKKTGVKEVWGLVIARNK